MDRRGGFGGYPNMKPAHGMDRFGEEFMRQGQDGGGPSRPPTVGRMGENTGGFAMQASSGYPGSGAVVRTDDVEAVTPISALNPYTNRWLIVARCTSKSDIRKFVNKNGEGQVFSFDLIDNEDSEIRCTGFGDVVERLFPVVEVGRVYRVSNATLVNRSKFCHLDHEYEIRLNSGSVVDEMPEQPGGRAIPFIKYNFKSIEMMKDMEVYSVLDVLGVIVSSEPSRTITKKNGDEVQKKTITIKDDSGFAVDLFLWDDHAINSGRDIDQAMEDGQTHIIAGKGLRVVEFNGTSLSTLSSSSVQLDPDLHEASLLRQWALRSGTSLPLQTLRQPMAEKDKKKSALADITLNSVQSGKPAFFRVFATVTYIKGSSMYYPACPLQRNGRNCLKKLLGDDRNFSCEACGQDVEEPNWRYILALQVRDHTGNQFITAFDVAEEIMGIPARELRLIEHTPAFPNYIENARFKTKVFTLKATMENWNDNMRLKTTAIRQDDINYAEEADSLIDIIEKYGDQSENKVAASYNAPQSYYHGSVQPATPQGARLEYSNFMGASTQNFL